MLQATFNGSWFTKQPGKCYDKVGLDNVTCTIAMGCAESRDWLPVRVEAYAKYTTDSTIDASINSSSGPGSHSKTSGQAIEALIIALTLPSRAHTVYATAPPQYVNLSAKIFVSWVPGVGVVPRRSCGPPGVNSIQLPFTFANGDQADEFVRNNGCVAGTGRQALCRLPSPSLRPVHIKS